MLDVVNVVIKYSLLGSIDTLNLSKPVRFSGYTLKNGSQTARVYLNGICMVTGVKSVAEGDSFVRRNFPNNPIITRNVKNMTAVGRIPFVISPFKILEWHQRNITVSPFRYEGEIFPAVYWIEEPETVYFFMSGAVIVTGVKLQSRLDPIWTGFLSCLRSIMEK